MEDIYLASYANLCWTAYLAFPGPRVWTRCTSMLPALSTDAPFGRVTVLDYAASRQGRGAVRRPHPERAAAHCAGSQALPHPCAHWQYIGFHSNFTKSR